MAERWDQTGRGTWVPDASLTALLGAVSKLGGETFSNHLSNGERSTNIDDRRKETYRAATRKAYDDAVARGQEQRRDGGLTMTVLPDGRIWGSDPNPPPYQEPGSIGGFFFSGPSGAYDMADFKNMGGMPTGYSDLLNAARQSLVRMPDGTYAPAPQRNYDPPSLDAIYGGILPASPPSVPGPLKTRSVNTVPVDAYGNPIIPKPGFVADTMGATQGEQRSGARPSVTIGTQPAGTAQLPPGVTPNSVLQAFAQMGIQPSGGTGRGHPTQTAEGTTYFPTGTGQYGYNAVTGEYEIMQPGNAYTRGALPPNSTMNNPALGAIDQLTGSGNSTFPRPLPMAFAPRGVMPPAQIPLTSLQPSGNVPQLPGAITFKKGDTVSALAKKLGMTTSSFSDLYGISNPDKIYAGDTVVPQLPTMPRLPSSAQRTPSGLSAREKQIAEFHARGLNDWGMTSTPGG